MKILVSDYDGTLKPEDNNFLSRTITLKLNINSIKKFMKNGNKFIINTGRRFKTIKKEIEKYKIPFDYIICNNGLVAYDNSFNMIYAKYIDDELSKEIINVFETTKIMKKLFLYDDKGNDNNKNLIKIGIKPNKFEKVKNYVTEIKINNSNLDIYHDFSKNVFWIHNYSNKAAGIQILLDKLNINYEKENVYTIGNSQNDLEMIEEYNGYFVQNTFLDTVKNNQNVPNVHIMIKKLIKKNK